MTVPLRAALYLRVSTARQAEHDVSIPDQKRQGEAYCAGRGTSLSRPSWSRARRSRTTADPSRPPCSSSQRDSPQIPVE